MGVRIGRRIEWLSNAFVGHNYLGTYAEGLVRRLRGRAR